MRSGKGAQLRPPMTVVVSLLFCLLVAVLVVVVVVEVLRLFFFASLKTGGVGGDIFLAFVTAKTVVSSAQYLPPCKSGHGSRCNS